MNILAHLVRRTHVIATTTILATLVTATLTALPGCAASRATPTNPRDDAQRIAGYLTGWFDSQRQAERAPDDFRNVRLVTIPIWPDRRNGHWLYVEQAIAEALERPYRQRVYHVHRDHDGVLRSDVYTLPGDASSYAACWTRPDPLADLGPSDLSLRAGCSIIFEPSDGVEYHGRTDGTGCSSTLRGASYATSIVSLNADRIVSWDQGWNDDGEQVWGATVGGYEFVRGGDGPPEG